MCAARTRSPIIVEAPRQKVPKVIDSHPSKVSISLGAQHKRIQVDQFDAGE